MDRDELARVLCLARLRIETNVNSAIEPADVDVRIADAALSYFREYLGREETVEAAGVALQTAWDDADAAGLHGLPEIDFTPDERVHLARAALTAIGGHSNGRS